MNYWQCNCQTKFQSHYPTLKATELYQPKTIKFECMKKRRTQSILTYLMLVVFSFFVSSCKKNKDENPTPTPPSTPISPTHGETTGDFSPDVSYGTMTDQEGNVYKTVTIGTQTWMAENLCTAHYNDGTAISNITDNEEWKSIKEGAFCNYNNTKNIDTIATYGRLYNWYAVNTGKLAPKGWHIPTNEEWILLHDYLGGEYIAGGKLKEAGIKHWISPNNGGSNESGFTALPAGTRYDYGVFSDFGYYAHWWASTEFSSTNAAYHSLTTINADLHGSSHKKELGFSVRCVMDK